MRFVPINSVERQAALLDMDVSDLSHFWSALRQPFMAVHLERRAVIDETSLKTDTAKAIGEAPRAHRVTARDTARSNTAGS